MRGFFMGNLGGIQGSGFRVQDSVVTFYPVLNPEGRTLNPQIGDRSRLLQVCATAALVVLFCLAPARAATPLYEEEPYDQVVLDAANNHAVLKVKPLDPPNRQLPVRHKPDEKLVVHLLDKPDAAYEVAWRSIAKIEPFEQLLLDKAGALVADGKFDEAYDYFKFLEQNRPNAPGLGKSMEEYLYEEAKQSHRVQRYDEALALLKELHRRNPQRPGLDKALGVTTDKLIDQYATAKDYAAARALLRGLAAEYADHPVVAQWEQRLKEQAAGLLAKAQAAADAGRLPEAAALSRDLTELWPQLPGARELALAIHRRYPRVVVGVATSAAELAPNRSDDWAGRRSARLVYRTLTEFAGPGSEGGKYDCPMGSIAAESLGRRLVVQIKPGIHWAQGSATLTGPDLSRRLLAMADPDDAAYSVDWAELLAAVSVRGLYGVEADLRRPHVRPEAMLSIVPLASPLPLGEGQGVRADHPLPANGPFQMPSRGERETTYTNNPQYFAAQAGQPKELVERRYASFTRAIAALKRGEIQAIDRLNPWNLAAARNEKTMVVEPYAMPLVHCLIPNLRKPLTADRTFRRALAYGIHRKAILDQMLAGAEAPGCRVTSSPFPVGTGVNDPIGYASDETIEPRPYDPRLTIALAGVALKTFTASQKEQGKEAKKMPRLTLAYPPGEVAQAACASIKRQLELVGIPLDLRALQGPLPRRIPDDVDLLYAELAIWEPAVDARRVLGETGPAGGCSPYMGLALRQLDAAADWSQVGQRLRQIHRIAYEEASVIPLWQLTEHFAYQAGLKGIAANPVSLYQTVEHWRPTFQYPTEK
jgi:MarR-like DNA-binding transcriptional regulator SgrR of sgrS sRNA